MNRFRFLLRHAPRAAACALTLTAAGARAQSAAPPAGTAIVTAPPPNPGHIDLSPPVFGSQNSLYDLSPTATGPAGAGTKAPSPAANIAYSFAEYAKTVHGFVSAGVSSTGGHEFTGGAELPLVPDRAELDVGVTQGNTGGFKPFPGSRNYSSTYTGYYAGLHLHPADNFDAYIGVSGLRFAQPQP